MGRPKIIICRPKLIICSPKDTKISSVFVASICSENETPAKAKRGLNEIYTKYKEYEIYKESIEFIKTVEINGFGMVFSTPC